MRMVADRRRVDSLSARYKKPAFAGFFVSVEEVGQMKCPVRSTRVRLLGRRAQEDVDAGDARSVRAMELFYNPRKRRKLKMAGQAALN